MPFKSAVLAVCETGTTATGAGTLAGLAASEMLFACGRGVGLVNTWVGIAARDEPAAAPPAATGIP